MTAVTLLLDWPLAMLVGLIAQLGLLALGRQDLAALGVNGVLLVVIPVWVTEVCALWVERRAAAQSVRLHLLQWLLSPRRWRHCCVSVAALALLWLDGCFRCRPGLEDFIGYLWLVIFPEAFINGMLVTALVVFYPDWLETFNRTRYLAAPWKDDDLRVDGALRY